MKTLAAIVSLLGAATTALPGYAVADGKLFDLTPQVLELGYSVLSSKGVWDIARPFIDHLSEEIRESVSARSTRIRPSST